MLCRLIYCYNHNWTTLVGFFFFFALQTNWAQTYGNYCIFQPIVLQGPRPSHRTLHRSQATNCLPMKSTVPEIREVDPEGPERVLRIHIKASQPFREESSWNIRSEDRRSIVDHQEIYVAGVGAGKPTDRLD